VLGLLSQSLTIGCNQLAVITADAAVGRTFVHYDGKQSLYACALAAWTRYRVVAAREHVVYLLRLATGALYVGLARLDRFAARMKEHQRNAQRDAPDSPRAAYLKRHGWDGVNELRLVPDRIAALLH
jgi:hypothetical protein